MIPNNKMSMAMLYKLTALILFVVGTVAIVRGDPNAALFIAVGAMGYAISIDMRMK